MLIHTDTIKIPTYAICYLEYGDCSALEHGDIQAIDFFLERYNSPVFEYGEEKYFSHNPAFGLGMTCVECKVFEQEQK